MLDARDPVCGMTVEVTTAFSEAVGGDTYYFCSEGCRERFDEDPTDFGADAPHTTTSTDSATNIGFSRIGDPQPEVGPERLDGRKGPA